MQLRSSCGGYVAALSRRCRCRRRRVGRCLAATPSGARGAAGGTGAGRCGPRVLQTCHIHHDADEFGAISRR